MRWQSGLLLLILLGAVAWSFAPPHQQALARGLAWWSARASETETNWLPNERGLNVAVLDADGRLLTAKSFDTFLSPDTGFPAFVGGVDSDSWVIVAIRDEATLALSPGDLAALESLGGTQELSEKYRHAYVLVGRPGLPPGSAHERLDPGALELRLEQGDMIAGAPLPVTLLIWSAGYEAGDRAGLRPASLRYGRLWDWLGAAIRRL